MDILDWIILCKHLHEQKSHPKSAVHTSVSVLVTCVRCFAEQQQQKKVRNMHFLLSKHIIRQITHQQLKANVTSKAIQFSS